MRAIIAVEYDLDVGATDNPFPEMIAELRRRLPDTPAATALRAHVAIGDAADRVFLSFDHNNDKTPA